VSLWTDLRNLVSWSTDWQILFNIDKCKVMHLGYNNPQAHHVMEATPLQGVSKDRDLEIIIVSEYLKCKNIIHCCSN